MAAPGRHWKDWACQLWDFVLEFNAANAPSTMKHADIITFNNDFVVIKDKYPKGKIHWLVLPRQEMLEEICLLTSEHLPLLRKMQDLEKELIVMARKETGNESLECWSGFHSWPSMKLLHLHFISSELNGPKLTSASHWISFTTSFFIRLPIIISRIEKAGNPQIDLEAEKKLKKGKPTCPICLVSFPASEKGVQSVKEHYQTCQAPTASSSNENPS